MARGTRGCDAALRPRGRAAGWPTRVAGGARRGHVAKGHATTLVHVGAREGRHVADRFAYGGPTRIVGPGKNLGAVTQMRYPPFNLFTPNSIIFSVWDYLPHGPYLCR